MTSLPTSFLIPPRAELLAADNEQSLLQAFRSFAETASSLENSYARLRGEVERLHSELAQSHAGLERSLGENRAVRRHLDRILNGLPCGVLVAEWNGKVTLLNPEGRRLLDFIREAEGAKAGKHDFESQDSESQDSVAQDSVPLNFDSWNCNSLDSSNIDSLNSDSLNMVPAELRELLRRSRIAPGELELAFEDKTGAKCWLAVRHAAVPQPQPSGEHDSNRKDLDPETTAEEVSVFILRDVSDAKRRVQEREKSRREQALAEMSAILAHEVRNPLGSLELFAGLLANAGLPAECREWVEHVQAGLRTLAATVNNVLHFHSLPPADRVPMDVGRLLDWATGFMVPMARQARVELSVRNRLKGVWFSADRHRLEQVLLNLVLNAFHAMPGGGWVEIAGQKIRCHEGDAIAICVSDTGPGVRPGETEGIFEPGFSTRAGSPGLGLTVCRKIVEQHGGSLAATNPARAGASFTITFPLHEESRREEARTEGAG